jgi:DNA-binding IclR family transcriptional regulator
MAEKKSNYDVPSLKTGFEMLDYLSRHPRGMVLTDITAALDCPVSSAYRISMALEDLGLVSRDAETKQIRLTSKLLLIGQRAIAETNFDRGGYPVAAIWTTGLMMDLDRKRLPEIGLTKE